MTAVDRDRTQVGEPGSRDTALMAAVTAISHAANSEFDVRDLLRRLVDVAVEHLEVDGAGVMIAEGDRVVFIHANAPHVAHVERIQEFIQGGPCHLAITTQAEVVVNDVDDRTEDWPEYVQGARGSGLHAMVAVPLLSRGRCWGALDLYRRSAGPWNPVDLTTVRLLAELAASYLAVAQDRDRALAAQRELSHRSTHDGLTGLPNRSLLFDRLSHGLSSANRHGRSLAVFFMDVDRFKDINDTFGHAAGDAVLTEIARRLKETVRDEDTLARLAGDEFVLIHHDVPRTDDHAADLQLAAVAERVRRSLTAPIRLRGLDVVISVSIGIAVSDGTEAAEDLLGDADTAMFRAKQRRRTEPVVREPNSMRRSFRTMERQLAQGVRDGQLRVHYQPIVTATEHRLEAVEALLRWEHPTLGMLPAGDFIDVAEHTGLIVPIGQWLVEEVSAQMARWQSTLRSRAPQTAYVNVSPRELTDPAMAATLEGALRRNGLQPSHIGLELLEAAFLYPTLVPALLEYQQRGHPLSIDDFGTGYSSLSRLVKLPVASAKIDREFVAEMTSDPKSRALIDAVITVGTGLGLRIVAEGVENEAQAVDLAEAGCHLLQGFQFGRPAPAEQLTAEWAA
jgi:diguanylate cyclase (GGDEF)-like protein